tara:strand:+ start:3138 stop:3989 length:852 start_codon:yes stop_codon:yes gene_type:complete
MEDATKPSMPQPGRSLFSRFRKKAPMRTRWGIPSADAINLRSRVIALEQENNTLKNEVSILENKNEFLQQENLMLKVKVDETKDKMKKVFAIKNLRHRVIQDVLDKKYQDERKEYLHKMRNKHGRDLDIGTFTEGNLVLGDVNIPRTRPVVTKPVVTKPVVTKPIVTKPVVTKSVVAEPDDIKLTFVGGSVKKKKKPKKTKKAKKTKKPRRSKGKKTNGKGKLKKMCSDECKKTRKVMPLVFKKMGLSKEEIAKKMKEHDEQCVGNCFKLIQDKEFIQEIMKK